MAALKGVNALALVMAVVCAVVLSGVSAQDVASPAPTPSVQQGAAYSFGASGAVICSSLLLSVLAFLKQ
ncbi:hypothetical protein Pint_24027 [Pistacia integerrima]|uniref:Uncharacterized protein n=2 Tax=Pistacia TaxID=55512 RepID=A0ACC1B5W7_9ROSI|nr:hypothetical protein Pint_24027 [Pistacia integerrima]KAJ0094282.1 hypothetical protein Patl1_17227 [Pistacia atlantica]